MNDKSKTFASGGPDFVGVGMQRCGTTWAADMLAQHPGILMIKKEVNFFVRYYRKGTQWYHDWFCDKGDRVAGEFSPNYMISPRPDPACKELYPSWNPRRKLLFWMREPSARDELRSRYPNVKVLAVFRNPVERAWSAYWFWCRKKKEQGKRVVPFEKMWADDGRWIRTIGFYADYLRCWRETFPDMGVFFYDDILNEPLVVARNLYRFTGVDDSFEPDITVQPKKGSYEKMPLEIRCMLTNFYRKQILELAEITNRDLSGWLVSE